MLWWFLCTYTSFAITPNSSINVKFSKAFEIHLKDHWYIFRGGNSILPQFWKRSTFKGKNLLSFPSHTRDIMCRKNNILGCKGCLPCTKEQKIHQVSPVPWIEGIYLVNGNAKGPGQLQHLHSLTKALAIHCQKQQLLGHLIYFTLLVLKFEIVHSTTHWCV